LIFQNHNAIVLQNKNPERGRNPVPSEFINLIRQASLDHRSSPAFAQELIRVLVHHSQPVDQCREDEQVQAKELVTKSFCQTWSVERSWLDHVASLYVKAAGTDVGHQMRVALTSLATAQVIAFPQGRKAQTHHIHRRVKSR
jgi:hypothetical protein